MCISPKYADRTDLSRAEKWKFTIEDAIRCDPRIRRRYLGYYFAPEWLKNIVNGICILAILVPCLGIACWDGAIIRGLLKQEDYDGNAGLVLFGLTLLALAYLLPSLGLTLIGFTALGTTLLWLCSTVFYELENDCRRIFGDKKSYEARRG